MDYYTYSDWDKSNWKCFWNLDLSGETKNDQVLSLWYVGETENHRNFYFYELLDFSKTLLESEYKISIHKSDISLAFKYIEKFKKDIEEEFKYETKIY